MSHARSGFAVGLLVLLQAAQGAAQDSRTGPGEERGRSRPAMANPSAVIAADLALGRNAREKGEGAALRDAAAPAAVVMAPRPVPAAAWLKRFVRRADAPVWQPQIVWTSCDGGYAFTRGAWRRASQRGEYFALWQRQANGDWRWLLHEEGPAKSSTEPAEMISGRVAECADLPRRPPGFVPPPVSPLADSSRDGSLEWTVRLSDHCGLGAAVQAWDGKTLREILAWSRPPPPDGCG